MKNNYEERAKKFIHDIYDYIFDCIEPKDYEKAINIYNYIHSRKVKVQHGLTRVAFITSDYVIKVNCGWASNIKAFGDCDKEVVLYKMAEEDGFAYLFAKITPYEYGYITFYIMPRIYGIGRTFNDANYYMSASEEQWCNDKGIFDLHNGNYGWRNEKICIFDYAANSI